MAEEKEKAVSAMQPLVDRLNELNYHYYTLDQPLVADIEYDQLYDQLLAMEKESGVILPDSPSQRIGGQVLEAFNKHSHLGKLYSLDKSRSEEEVAAWAERCQKLVADYNQSHADAPLPEPDFLCELKFDGLTINLTYDQGRLVRGTTRGDGSVGEDVTAQIKTIRSIPFHIPYQGLIEVQGEGLMPFSSLEKYNEKADVPLKNPRNGAAGAIRNLDPAVTASRQLDCYLYQVGYAEEELFRTEVEMMDFLRANHFKVHPFLRHCLTVKEIMEVLAYVKDYRQQIDLATDGVVIKLNDLRSRRVLGATAKFPRWALAYKYAAEEVTTLLKGVEWKVGRTGKLTPTAVLEPVEIGGATVSRATLNNYDDIQRKKLRLGGRVFIRRSNEVIPEILGMADDPSLVTRPIEKPGHCPACGTELLQGKVHLYCPNSLSCRPQLVARMTHYASRHAMDIDGLSEKTIALFVEKGMSELSELYDLKAGDLLALEGFKEKKTEKLLQAIEESKHRPLYRFINAIGIPGVGEQAARDLADHFGSFEAVERAGQEELESMEDFGPVTAKNIVDFFHDPAILPAIHRLLSKGLVLEGPDKGEEEAPAALPLAGKRVVITGSIEGYNRQQMEELVRRLGGRPQGSVSKKTDLLLAGEAAGSKKDKAEELSVPILEGEELADFLQNYGG